MSIDRGVWVRGRYFPPIAGGAPDGDPPLPPTGGETPPNPPAAPPATPPVVQGHDGEPFDAERAQRTIDAQRQKERELTAKVKELEPLAKRAKELEDAQKTDLEKAQTQLAELQAKLTAAEATTRDRAIRSEVRIQASELGFADAEDAWRFIDQAAIELDDKGEPKNVKKLLEDLLKAKPYLAKATNGTAAIPGTPRPSGQAQTQDEMVAAAEKRLAQSGRYGRM